MNISYVAFDKSGSKVSGILEAANMMEASGKLRQQGLFSSSMKAAEDSAAALEGLGRAKAARVGRGRRLRFLTAFCRQIHILMTSGTPLVQALMAAERQAKDPRWNHVVKALRERVESGTSLAAAMASNPEYFDPVCRSLVAAGELSGNLGVMMERLAILMRKQMKLRTTIVGALVYPCLLMLVAVAVTILMLMFVLPRFSDLFKTLDSPLPPTTKLLLGLSDWLQTNWWLPPIALGAGLVAVTFWLRRPSSNQALSGLALKVPKLGFLTRNLMSARISRLLGMLLESKLPLVEALKLTRQSAVIAQYDQLLGAAENAVVRGSPMSSVLAESDLITPYVQEALRNGEQSGQLSRPLVQIADFLDEENEVIVKTMTSLLEPCILIVLGGVVGVMALSMFLPLFDLVANAGGSGK